MEGTAVAIQYNTETLRVAKYLEGDLTYHATEELVMVWYDSGLPVSSLGRQLRALMTDVSAASNDGLAEIDLTAVDWLSLAERYREIFIDEER